MKSVQINYLGKPLHQVYPHATKWQVMKWKMTRGVRWLALRFAIAILATGLLTGAYFYGVTASAQTVSYIATPAAPGIAPVLQRIMKAESGNSQTNAAGQVLIHVNPNGTYDEGIAQINSSWDATATKLGYDLSKEADNIAFAEYLYANYGTSPWSSSQSKWQ